MEVAINKKPLVFSVNENIPIERLQPLERGPVTTSFYDNHFIPVKLPMEADPAPKNEHAARNLLEESYDLMHGSDHVELYTALNCPEIPL